MPRVCLTVDFEPDCPPYLNTTFRGIEQGAPALLALFAEHGVRATYFTTGEVAARYPDAVRALVRDGHELGCHGVSHAAFDELDEATARREIADSARLLRTFAPVTSFRAPYLRFPNATCVCSRRRGSPSTRRSRNTSAPTTPRAYRRRSRASRRR
ncbi:MAG: polysaccharide deacetylase family protein [Gemmatimonadaceae bacterium]|nr:polysaccharide deacetylase family protein [Gemmatimonadaceae bacterium]